MILRVAAIDDDAEVRTVTLVADGLAGEPLPAYVPGSHLVLGCGDRRNAYSLLDSGSEPRSYRVSVLRNEAGAGGSTWIHTRLCLGTLVESSLPRSGFAPVTAAKRHLLLAAGIGVTPLLSHAAAAREWGRPVTMLYQHRPAAAAHLEELRALLGDDLVETTSRAACREALERLLVSQPLGTHLYACGPAGFLDLVVTRAEAWGWPDQRVHTERFANVSLDPGRAFTARIRSRGVTVPVASGRSLLDGLLEAGLAVPNRCRQGVCGECLVGVIRGVPEHRDLYLSTEERSRNDRMLACVSRGHTELELNL